MLSTPATAAEDAEQLDAAFLEYLANLEGDDDDWTLIAEPEDPLEKAQPARKPDSEARPSSGKSSSKAPEPAERAAVDER